MGKQKRILLVLILLTGFLPFSANGQEETIENSIFWEVKGKDLQTPSYLFGTFHLMGSNYIDSLTDVIGSFDKCATVVGEILLDSSMSMKMMVAAKLDGTTLDKLLTKEDYQATAAWLKELSGYDLAMFNSMNPVTIQIFLMTMLQQKYFPMSKSGDEPMDLYFQNRGKIQGKNLVGLEDFETQVNALFHQFTLKRQAEMLMQFVHEKERAGKELIQMNRSYRDGNLADLERLLSEQNYTKSESQVMLDDRNLYWMQQLPILMREQSTFIAVGALHLAGQQGLVSLFRKAGYTVTPIPSK